MFRLVFLLALTTLGGHASPRMRICGITLVAPPKPFPSDPMPELLQVGANWVAVIPYAYTRPGKPSVHFAEHDWQWWGERPEGCRKTVEMARANGLHVMVKPQVYLPGSWPGNLSFPTDAEWEAWEKDYTRYILTMAEIAQSCRAEVFCVGTEFKISAIRREDFWRELIRQVRQKFKGKLVYAANWDEYQLIPFWDALDFIGIDAYFPLADHPTPDPAALMQAWQPYLDDMEQAHKKWGKAVLFTEFGYLSVDGCAGRTWELEGKVRQLPINEAAQANALEGLFSALWNQDFWAGGFLWKWFPHMQGHEGYPERDYTPQGKQAEAILERWYCSINH